MMHSMPSTQKASAYRSSRSVKRQQPRIDRASRLSNTKKVVLILALVALSMTVLLPMILVEISSTNVDSRQPNSVHDVIQRSKDILKNLRGQGQASQQKSTASVTETHDKVKKEKPTRANKIVENPKKNKVPTSTKTKPSGEAKAPIDTGKNLKVLARGVAGLPMSQTPALEGARWGHIECDTDVDNMAYWNEPQGIRDQNFLSPFGKQDSDKENRRYMTFEPDPGGWNNIRMSMEIIFIIAATTGRTLVLPPKAPFYLLGMGEKNARSFGSFYDISKDAFQKEVEVISMQEFFEREVFNKKTEDKNLMEFLTETDINFLKGNETAKLCLYRDGAGNHCENLYKHLRKAGYQPPLEAGVNCFVFDQDVFHGQDVSDDVKKRVDRFCGEKRTPVYYNQTFHEPELIHWDASGVDASKGGHRLLNHFYSFLFFSDPVVDNHYKRFVRDFLHYKDSLYCAAGKIVAAINSEGKKWSTLHVRRGDLQYKEVKISGEEWYENLKDTWDEDEMLFIATDERNKTFFDPIKKHHEIRFLDDYWEVGKLGELDPYFLSMVDTIIASHGRSFAGTWFSTFTGYINRMRGYLGYSIKDSWYSFLPRKDAVRDFKYPTGNYGAREWPIGWVAIDSDEIIEHEGNPVMQTQTSVKSDSGGSAVVESTRKINSVSTDESFLKKPLRRGIAGRPESETPALLGGSRGSIKCDINIDSMAYWNDPQGTLDQNFTSPFLHDAAEEKYITFSTDRGGWNNVRMSMEIIFLIAAATGRTLVLPPKEPLYRLNGDKKNKQRGFADFFPLDTPEFAKRVKIITMAEFVEREGGPDGRLPIPDSMRENVKNSAETCEKRKKAKNFCDHVKNYLTEIGHLADVRAADGCIIFDKDMYDGNVPNDDALKSASDFCGDRKQFIWTASLNEKTVIHFQAGEKEYRLLAHFYGMIHFTNPLIDNHFKRFVRDFLHYNDQIYCAAGKIVKALQAEAKQRNFSIDEEGSGGYSAMHIRRGDFQYKKVKISAEDWYENTKELWEPNEILFIATDERDKSFFDPIAKHHDVRFLDDYWDTAGLGGIDSNFFGMIDTIVSSRARVFAGTFFSTFTGYINRMRGYHGMSMKDSWYSYLPRKKKAQTWEKVNDVVYAYEYPDGWIGIDADVHPDKTEF